jgi:8-oxo-dGTP diphosphatase
VVDVANVMGARADGWWRDRAGAAARLGREVMALADRGIEGSFPCYVFVLEGQARAAAAVIESERTESERTETGSSRVRVVSGAGSGDDSIVAEVAALGGSCLVVTADRELRRRCAALGATVTGPGWLLGLL